MTSSAALPVASICIVLCCTSLCDASERHAHSKRTISLRPFKLRKMILSIGRENGHPQQDQSTASSGFPFQEQVSSPDFETALLKACPCAGLSMLQDLNNGGHVISAVQQKIYVNRLSSTKPRQESHRSSLVTS